MAAGTAPSTGEPVSLSWFNPFAVDDPAGLVAGVILCLFIYWGWDALISVNEETTHRSSTPGRAVIISTVILLVLYCGASVARSASAGSTSSRRMPRSTTCSRCSVRSPPATSSDA